MSNNIKEIRVFAERLSFPVLLFVCDDRQRELVMRFAENMRSTHYRTEDVCRWAHVHGIDYRIYISPLDRLLPWRHLKYLRITRSL